MNLPYSETVGFCGLIVAGLWINLAQVFKTLRRKSVGDVSVWVYRFLLIYVSCLMYRALDIGETVYIASNALSMTASIWMLILIRKYRKGKKGEW